MSIDFFLARPRSRVRRVAMATSTQWSPRCASSGSGRGDDASSPARSRAHKLKARVCFHWRAPCGRGAIAGGLTRFIIYYAPRTDLICKYALGALCAAVIEAPAVIECRVVERHRYCRQSCLCIDARAVVFTGDGDRPQSHSYSLALILGGTRSLSISQW